MNEPWRACPRCLTLHPRSPAICGECGQPLRWISDVADLDAALTEGKNSAWKPCAVLTSRWGQESHELECDQPGSFNLPAGPSVTFSCELKESLRQLLVRLNGRRETIDFPGERSLGGVQLHAKLVAKLELSSARVSEISQQAAEVFIPAEGVVLGRRQADSPHGRVSLQWTEVAMDHCLLVAEPQVGESNKADRQYWLVDLGSGKGTFVNRQPVLCHLLQGQDLVQVGPVAWTFYASEGLLVPTEQIQGVPLRLRGVQVGRLLGPLDVDVREGELVAIVGVSGSGKSTLMKSIVGVSGYRGDGTIRAGDLDASLHVEQFRAILGYVSQQSVIHPDLKCEQAMRYSAAFRCPGVRTDWRTVLQQVDFPRNRWRAMPEEVSGGEMRRLDTAVELVTNPTLLMMDEPTTGLDRGREQSVFKLLQNLRNRGCTVVVVTHSLSQLEVFDRVLVIHDKRVCYNGLPQEFLEQVPSGNLEEFHATDKIPPLSPLPAAAPVTEITAPTIRRRVKRDLRQGRLLLLRECRRFINRWWQRGLPLLGVPLFFAVSLHLAVSPVDLEGLGFLSLLSAIWLGASLSLLAVADERKVIDHERLVFLRTIPYMTAKTLFYWSLSFVQTMMFFLPLLGLRWWSAHTEDMLYGPGRVFLCLVLVGWASVGLGLVISVLVGRSRQLATAVLPLLMMVQILFSAQVLNKNQAGNLQEAYRHLHLHKCQGAENCPHELWGERFVRPEGAPATVWLCAECTRQYPAPSDQQDAARNANHQENAAPAPAPAAPSWLRQDVDKTNELNKQRRERPSRFAVLATYLTISRWGDIALRSFAYNKHAFEVQFEPEEGRGQAPRYKPDAIYYRYANWRHWALGWLLLLATGLPILSGCILFFQMTTTCDRLSRWLSARH